MGNIPSHNELCHRGGGRLDSCSNKHDYRPDEYCTSAAQFITEADDNERAYETTYLVDSDDESLNRAQLVVARHFRECTKKDWLSNDTAHDALVYGSNQVRAEPQRNACAHHSRRAGIQRTP